MAKIQLLQNLKFSEQDLRLVNLLGLNYCCIRMNYKMKQTGLILELMKFQGRLNI